jgi:phosphohistidine phosphatase SixA
VRLTHRARSKWAMAAFVGTICAVVGVGAVWIVPAILSERQEAKTVEAIQQGGYVIYLRHADRSRGAKEPFDANSPVAAFMDCTHQRNLTAHGREDAVQIGVNFRSMKVPIGQVLALPLCRTRETAQLAFGEADLDPHLYDPNYVEHLFGQSPSRGNMILVDTNYQVRQIAHVDLQPGEAAVFQPRSDGGFTFVGKLDQNDLDR